MASDLQIHCPCYPLSPSKSRTQKPKFWKPLLSLSTLSHNPTIGNCKLNETSNSTNNEIGGGETTEKSSKEIKISRKKRVFFLDVNPLCYKGSTPSLDSFVHWISLFFSQVSFNDPVIAAYDCLKKEGEQPSISLFTLKQSLKDFEGVNLLV